MVAKDASPKSNFGKLIFRGGRIMAGGPGSMRNLLCSPATRGACCMSHVPHARSPKPRANGAVVCGYGEIWMATADGEAVLHLHHWL